MFITNDPKMAQFYINDSVTRVCLFRRQYYIYYKHDHDVLDYHPNEEVTIKKIKTLQPNVGNLKPPTDIDLNKQLFQYNFIKGVLSCNELSPDDLNFYYNNY